MPENRNLDGAIVGAKRVVGRWPQKSGIEFKRPGDRVRVNIPGQFGSLTFACWVKIDSLDRWYNSLFLTDSYQRGEPHWQILDTGQLFFSVRLGGGPGKGHHKVLSPPFWDASLSGRWLHLATTYNVETKITKLTFLTVRNCVKNGYQMSCLLSKPVWARQPLGIGHRLLGLRLILRSAISMAAWMSLCCSETH